MIFYIQTNIKLFAVFKIGEKIGNVENHAAMFTTS